MKAQKYLIGIFAYISVESKDLGEYLLKNFILCWYFNEYLLKFFSNKYPLKFNLLFVEISTNIYLKFGTGLKNWWKSQWNIIEI